MLKCIIIPAYNEFENINLILKEIYKNNFEDIRVVIVDDSKRKFCLKIKSVLKNTALFICIEVKKWDEGLRYYLVSNTC